MLEINRHHHVNIVIHYITCKHDDKAFDESDKFCVQFDAFCAVLSQFCAMSVSISVAGTVSPSDVTELSQLLFSVYN